MLIPWLLDSQGHEQQWYRLRFLEIFWFQHQRLFCVKSVINYRIAFSNSLHVCNNRKQNKIYLITVRHCMPWARFLSLAQSKLRPWSANYSQVNEVTCPVIDRAPPELTPSKIHKTGPSSDFIKSDQLDPWIKDQVGNALMSTILHLQLINFVSCGRACPWTCPSHMTQNLVTVLLKLLTWEWFLFDPWSMDQAAVNPLRLNVITFAKLRPTQPEAKVMQQWAISANLNLWHILTGPNVMET